MQGFCIMSLPLYYIYQLLKEKKKKYDDHTQSSQSSFYTWRSRDLQCMYTIYDLISDLFLPLQGCIKADLLFFCPRTSRDREVCPGIFPLALLWVQRDGATGKTYFVLGQRDSGTEKILSQDRGTTEHFLLVCPVMSRGTSGLLETLALTMKYSSLGIPKRL